MEHNGITNGADLENDLNWSLRLQFDRTSEEPGLGEAALSSGSPVLRAGARLQRYPTTKMCLTLQATINKSQWTFYIALTSADRVRLRLEMPRDLTFRGHSVANSLRPKNQGTVPETVPIFMQFFPETVLSPPSPGTALLRWLPAGIWQLLRAASD
jgi:hypothetical protein